MLSCEICEIFKNTFYYRTRPVASSRDLPYQFPSFFFIKMSYLCFINIAYFTALKRIFMTEFLFLYDFNFHFFFCYIVLLFVNNKLNIVILFKFNPLCDKKGACEKIIWCFSFVSL